MWYGVGDAMVFCFHMWYGVGDAIIHVHANKKCRVLPFCGLQYKTCVSVLLEHLQHIFYNTMIICHYNQALH